MDTACRPRPSLSVLWAVAECRLPAYPGACTRGSLHSNLTGSPLGTASDGERPIMTRRSTGRLQRVTDQVMRVYWVGLDLELPLGRRNCQREEFQRCLRLPLFPLAHPVGSA